MFRSYSIVFWSPASRVWWEMICCHLFFLTYHTSDAILGHIPFRVTFTDLHWVARSSLLVRCVPRWWLVGHFYEDSSVETLGSHLVRLALLDTQMSSCFLPGYAYWMFVSNSVMDLDDRDHTFDEGWFDVTYFSGLSHIWCYTGACSISDEIYGPSWSCMTIITYWMHTETLTCSLPYHDTSVEPFNQVHISRHLVAVMLLIPGDVSLTFGFDLDYGDRTFDDGWLEVTWFFWPITHLMSCWGIFPFSAKICRSPLICMIIPDYEIRTRLMIRFHFVLILQWSLSWVISSDLYFLI